MASCRQPAVWIYLQQCKLCSLPFVKTNPNSGPGLDPLIPAVGSQPSVLAESRASTKRTQGHCARDFRLPWSQCCVTASVTLQPPSFFFLTKASHSSQGIAKSVGRPGVGGGRTMHPTKDRRRSRTRRGSLRAGFPFRALGRNLRLRSLHNRKLIV